MSEVIDPVQAYDEYGAVSVPQVDKRRWRISVPMPGNPLRLTVCMCETEAAAVEVVRMLIRVDVGGPAELMVERAYND